MTDTIPHRVAQTAATAPATQGIAFEGVHHDFAAMARQASALAGWLEGLGIGTRDVVALYLPTRMELLLAHLAGMARGAITLPLNTAYTGDELAFILGDARARLVVTDRAGAEVIAPVRAQLPDLRHVAVVPEEPAPEAPAAEAATPDGTVPFGDPEGPPGPALAEAPVAAGDVAMIMYTSGTTGRPKGAQLTHGNIVANLDAILQAWRIDANDRFLLTLPLFHAHGLVLGLHGTLFSGCLTFLRARYEADEVLRELAERRCTLFMGVPTHYFRFLRSPELDRVDLSAMRLFTSGSAPLDDGTFREFETRTGQAILERYGLTETLFNTGNPYDGERKPGTVGVPFPGVRISVQDEAGRCLPDGSEGEICVQGPNVFLGYLNRPEATAEAMRDGWFRTGDLGRIRTEDGYLEILGRAKDLIITGGYNVYPKEVETVLNALPGVDDCAVVGIPSPEWGETVHAVVVPGEGAAPDPEALLAEAARHLAKYKVPRSVELVEALPRNAMGKVQKSRLRRD